MNAAAVCTVAGGSRTRSEPLVGGSVRSAARHGVGSRPSPEALKLFIYLANSAQFLLSLAELRRERQVEVNGTKHLATHQLFTLHLILIQVTAGGR